MAMAATRLLHLLFLCSLCCTSGDGQTLYEKQPRLRTQNGNLLIVSAKDRNITFKTMGSQSYVNIDGENLIGLVAQAKSAVTAMKILQEGTLDTMQKSLTALSNDLYRDGGVMQRTTILEAGAANLTKNATRTRRVILGKISTLSTRFKRLERNFNTLQRNLRKNDCESNPCKNGGICEDAFKTFYCRCPSGWTGPTCEDDVNECTRFIGTDLGCQNGATCINKPGTYECLCASGYYGLHCTQSSNNCTTASAIELCGHGTCIPQRIAGRSFSCLCDQGWKTNPITGACTDDVNECELLTRPACSVSPPVPCVNTPGSFMCGACPAGYSGNGYYCSDIDECLVNNGGCSENPKVFCYNTMGSRMCGPCPPGFSGDGMTCTPSKPCSSNNGGCHPMARCYDNPNIGASYVQCACPPGYQGAGFGPTGCIRSSENVTDVCTPNPCAHGTCYPSSTNYFSCVCFPGYKGYLCEAPIMDICNPNPCENDGVCVPQNGTYSCSCKSNFAGPQCQFRRTSCGGEIKQDSGMITYSTTQEHFSGGVNCLWHITVNETQVVIGQFDNFRVSVSPSCTADWVQIHDGPRPTSPSIGTFCGSKVPPANISSTSNSIVLWYYSPRGSLESSFGFRWWTQTPTCGGIFSGQTQGTIKSPGFPAPYPTNRDCVWSIRVKFGKRVQLHIFTLQMRQNSNCEKDYIEIKDGNLPSSRVLRKVCNNTDISPITSSGSQLLVNFRSGELKSEEGRFEMTFTEIPGVDGCGGTWTSERGEITSPNYPRLYSGNLHCDFLIQLPINERIKITFVDMKIESAEGCKYDYLEIREGSSENSPLVSKVCGSDAPANFISNGNELLLIFHTDASNSLRGFKIKYETACGGIFTAPSGMFSSPNYPNNYPDSRICVYQIAQPLHKSIVLQFLDFELEQHDRCAHDFVAIRDGAAENSQFMGRFCGTRMPPITLSTRNFLWLKFKTDSTVTNKGFVANYSTVDTTCGGILTAPTGDFSSPNNGDACTYIIHVARGMVIRLNWRRIWSSISNPSANCMFTDYAQIFDNSTSAAGLEVGRFCGNKLPPTLTSQGDMMTIVFNQTMSSSEFELSYNTIKSSELCGGTYYTVSGIIKSPNFPKKYAQDLDCIYIIQVDSGQQISLNFTTFDLENSTDCSFDFVEIRNGQSGTSPLVGTFCGNTKPPVIPSHSNTLWIRFHTDNSLPAQGFRAIWDGASTGCGGILRSPSGHIESPNFPQPYGVNAECIWKIYVSKGNKINLWFVDLDLEKIDIVGTCYDYVEVRDGDNLNGNVLRKLCDSNNFNKQINSIDNSVTVIFKTDASDAGRGFSLRYQTDCNNTLTEHRGVIESPNFPGNYPHNSNCTWTIIAPAGNQINVSFSHFEIEDIGENCSVDYVQLRTSKGTDLVPERIGKYCSTEQKPQLFTTKYNILYVDFVTDFSVAYSGFRLEWVVHGCGGKFNAPYGNLQSPNYPYGYPQNTKCKWQIEVGYGKSVELTISDLQMETGNGCRFDHLQVFGGPDENSPLLLQACSSHERTLRVVSSGRYMTVVFESDSSTTGKGFSAYYRQMITGCGGMIQSNRGAFTSTNYPQNFEPNAVCNWLINVDPNFTITLKFEDFDIPKISNSCDRQYLAVWEGYNDKVQPLLKHCGGDIPPKIRSAGSTLLVRMVSSNETFSKGFSATFKAACGATIETTNYGIIKSLDTRDPEYGEFDTNNCTWIVVSKVPTARVTLTLTHLNIMHLLNPNNTECDNQYLDVHDGVGIDAPLVGKFCGVKIPPHIVSNGQALTINLVSDNMLIMPVHFTAAYSIEDTACGGTLTAEEGSFATPGYPGSYKLNAECIWQIAASAGNSVQVRFSMFGLEMSDGCNNDYVEIRSGNSGADPLMGVYCGSEIPNNLTSSARLWIKFRSDGQNVDSGFLAHYSFVHGGVLSGNSGQIASPMYPKPYTNDGSYWWRIVVRPAQIVRLTFQQMMLSTFGCSTSVRIYDGHDNTAALLREICDENVLPDPVISTGNIMYIAFESHIKLPGSLFLVSWNAEYRKAQITSLKTPGCGGIFNISNNGSIEFTSPGFPYGYGRNLLCEWIFEAPSAYHTALHFNTLDVEQHAICFYDYVAVYSGSRYSNEWTHIRNFCHPNATQVNGIHGSDLMKVIFKTDAMTNKTGFSATVFSACGGTLAGPSGSLEFYNMTRSLPHGLLPICEWNITVRPGRTIKVDIGQISTSDIPGCPDDYLMLKNVITNNVNSNYQMLLCGNTPPTGTIETLSNTLYVKFNVRKNYAQSGFSLTYQESSSLCGGRFTFTEGGVQSLTIMSPNYPNPPPRNTECEWVFIAPPGRRLRVDFRKAINMFGSRWCEPAYVQFFDGGTPIAPSLGKFCKDQPSSLLTSDNALFVRYQTTVPEPRNGFQADIKVDDCGGTISSNDNRIFEVPEKNENRPFICVWKILVPEGNLITYSFEDLDIESTSVNCTSDYVEIREEMKFGTSNSSLDVARSLSHPRYCGSNNKRSWVTTGTDEIIVTLNSTRGIGKSAKKYFKLTYRSVMQDCGGTINAPEGEIVSPGYPGSQARRQICSWKIQVPEGRRIKIEFLDFDLEGSQSGCQQWLGIYNGQINVMPIGLYCGGQNPGEVSSSSNKVLLQSLTWQTSSHRGFKLKFSSDLATVCEGNIQQNFGYLTFPKVNMSSIYCIWNRPPPLPESPKGTFAITIFNATMNGTHETSCFRSPRGILINSDSFNIAQICDKITSPKVITNPFPSTQITAKQSDLGNKVDFNIWYKFYECGGMLQGPIDNISSPSDMSMDCGWSLTYQYGQINLTTIDFNLTSDCSEQYLKVYNGRAPNYPLIGQFCKGNKPPSSILSQSNMLYVEYHGSKNIDRDTGFSLKATAVQKGCGGVYHIHSGLLTSPNFPKMYQNNSECRWEIVVDEGYHIGLKFVNRFFIESSSGCTKDYLEAFDYSDGNWNSLGKVCGREIPKPFNSTGNRMQVIFRSDNATTGDGFVGIWNVNCGGTITAREGYITSPSYPSTYGKFLNCKYLIIAPRKTIFFKFLDFNLEQGFQDCRYDNVTITKTSASKRNRMTRISVQTYCGQDAPPDGMSRNSLTVQFQTDKWIEKRGFRMHYVFDDCGGTINETMELSPKLSELNPDARMNCTWKITAPENKKILLRFEMVKVRQNSMCRAASIRLFDAPWPDKSKSIVSLCGNISDSQRVYVSKGNEATLVYSSYRSYIVDNPFSVAISFTYGDSVGCGGHVNLINVTQTMIGSFSTKGVGGNYENMLDCRWYVAAAPGEMIKLTVNNFAIKDCQGQTANSTCNCDYLEVRDGLNQFSPLLGRFCGNTRPEQIVSSGERLFIRFVSDDFESNKGFQATISKIASPCGQQVLQVTDSMKELVSPGFGTSAGYPANINCRWKLRFKDSMRFDIHLEELDLESSVGCQNDKLIITENAEPTEDDDVVYTGNEISSTAKNKLSYLHRSHANHESIFCGKGSQMDWYSLSNKVDVIFSTNSANAGKGFKLTYQLSRCSRNFTRQYGRIHQQGRIIDPNTGSIVYQGECSILISTDANRTIALYFSELYMHTANLNCSGASTFKVYDGASKSANVLAEYCGTQAPNPVFSSGQHLLIFAKQDLRWAEEGFDATYTTSDQGRGCGGIVRNTFGTLTSPLYPGKAKNYAECIWEITVPEGSFVGLIFTAFNIGPSDTCNTDYLKIYEINRDNGQEVLRNQLCGNDVPAAFSANSNSIRLKYTTSIHNSGTGWKLSYAAKKMSFGGEAEQVAT